jgi:hypothetical protein
MQARKDFATREFSVVQKAIMTEKLKGSEMFQTQKQRDLFEMFDCVPTPAMDQFDFVHSDKEKLIKMVKQLCVAKRFHVLIVYSSKTENSNPANRVTNLLKFGCARSPFFEQGFKMNQCPFHLIYKLDEDEEEYYLDCYDEMHNHVLTDFPRIIPMPRKSYCKARFQTPHFFRFEKVDARDEAELAAKVIQLARERCFDLRLVDPEQAEVRQEKGENPHWTKHGVMSKEMALLSPEETMFECKFRVHGLCQSKCLEKAASAKTRQEQFEMTAGAQHWEDKKRVGDKSYLVVKCPFKLIYSKRGQYTLIR